MSAMGRTRLNRDTNRFPQALSSFPEAVNAALACGQAAYCARLIDALYAYFDSLHEPDSSAWPLSLAADASTIDAMSLGASITCGLGVILSGPDVHRHESIFERFQFDTENNSLIDSLSTAIYTTDAEGRVTFFNSAAARLWGWRPPLRTQVWCGSWRIFEPGGSLLPHDQCPMAVCIRERRPVRNSWVYAERPDGVRVPFAPLPTPLIDAAGEVVGAYNVLIEVSDVLAA